MLEKIYKDDKNFAPNDRSSISENKKSSNATSNTFKPSFPIKRNSQNCINESFRNYSPDELEKLLRESRKGKF